MLSGDAKDLFDEALRTYRANVFWNMRPPATTSGLLAAAAALEKRGDLAAAMLAARMRESLKHAA